MEPITPFVPEDGVIYLPQSMQKNLKGQVKFLDEENMKMLLTYVEESKSKCELDWNNKDSLCTSMNCKNGCSFIMLYVVEPEPHCEFKCVC
jgi:streptomycin 6-kinase